jgi:hypothetical protein
VGPDVLVELLVDMPLEDMAKTLSCGLSLWLWHLGHFALSRPKTSVSNSCWHSWQTYSKIGMKMAPLDRTVPIRINSRELRKQERGAWAFRVQELSSRTT